MGGGGVWVVVLVGGGWVVVVVVVVMGNRRREAGEGGEAIEGVSCNIAYIQRTFASSFDFCYSGDRFCQYQLFHHVDELFARYRYHFTS